MVVYGVFVYNFLVLSDIFLRGKNVGMDCCGKKFLDLDILAFLACCLSRNYM